MQYRIGFQRGAAAFSYNSVVGSSGDYKLGTFEDFTLCLETKGMWSEPLSIGKRYTDAENYKEMALGVVIISCPKTSTKMKLMVSL